eukprot:2258386-Amphidinium_carterae.1
MEGTHSAICHGCMFGLTTKTTGSPMKKPFKIATTVQKLAKHLAKFVCDKSHSHALTQGADTVLTGNYTAQFCSEVMKALEDSTYVMNLDGAQSLHELYTGQAKNGYTVDAVDTTGWMDVVETDFQTKLRAYENNAGCYSDLVKQSPQWTEPLGEINTLYDEKGRVSINVTNALQDQEVPDFFATPVMKPLTLDAHQIFEDPAHYEGWVEATKAELASFDALG